MYLKISFIHEWKENRYKFDYKLKNKIVIGTISKASELKRLEDLTIGTTYKEYKIKKIIINGDGADWTGNIVEGEKEIFQLDMAHIQRKIFTAVRDEEYLKKMQEIVYTKDAKQILSLIYNYKVELEYDEKQEELEKVKELEKYLKNNIEGIIRYQYKLGYTEKEIEEKKEELPTLGSEESEMYSVCRERMKRNRTSWCEEGAEALLKVIMSKIDNEIKEILSEKAKEKIEKEISEIIPKPKKVKKIKYEEMRYAATSNILEHITRKSTKEKIKSLLKKKKCSELMLIN